MPPTKQTPNSFFLDLAFNLVIPVVILQNLSSKFGERGPLISLILALSFPLGFGLYDLFKKKKRNILSLLGFINILFTGGFALLGLTRNWYIGKELLLPSIIGIYVWSTTRQNTPLVEMMFFNEHIINQPLVRERTQEPEKQKALKKLFMRSTQIFAATFFLSAIANFFIARKIFTDIPYIWTATERAAIRNYEIAEMKRWHYIVLLIPSLFMTAGLMWYLFSGLGKITGLKVEQLMSTHSHKKN